MRKLNDLSLRKEHGCFIITFKDFISFVSSPSYFVCSFDTDLTSQFEYRVLNEWFDKISDMALWHLPMVNLVRILTLLETHELSYYQEQ